MAQPLTIAFVLNGKESPVVYYERWGAYTASALFSAEKCLRLWNGFKDKWDEVEAVLGTKLSPDERIQVMLGTGGSIVCEEDQDLVTPITPLLRYENNKVHCAQGGIFSTREEVGESLKAYTCGHIVVNLDRMSTELCCSCYCAADAYDEYIASDYDDDDPDIPFGGDAMKWFESLPEVDMDPGKIKLKDIKAWEKIIYEHDFFRLKGDLDDVYQVDS